VATDYGAFNINPVIRFAPYRLLAVQRHTKRPLTPAGGRFLLPLSLTLSLFEERVQRWSVRQESTEEMWKIKLSPEAEKQLRTIDRSASLKIQKYLKERVALNPIMFGKPLSANLKGFWRYRVEDYRIICDVRDKELVVLVVKIGHRSKVYDVF